MILILLRRLDVFIHFLGRYLDGIDEADVLREQIGFTAAVSGFRQRIGKRLVAMWGGLDSIDGARSEAFRFRRREREGVH